MYVRQFGILFFIFSSYCVQAQRGIDSLPLFSGFSSFELLDVKQQRNIKIISGDNRLSLFVFLSPECTLSQNYTKTISQLQQKFKQQVNIYGIIPGNAYTIKEVTDFENKYHTVFRILIDTKQQLTSYLKARVTPQAILLDARCNLIYTGAIDDWVQGLGKKKLRPDKHYVEDAIEQSLRSEVVKIKKTKVFGCRINDY